MIEQVKELKEKGIKSICLHGGMNQRDIDIALDNCIYGDVKLLYLAPERLNSRLVYYRLRKMDINLIAIDEAHCISQWGHDFRPEYKELGKLKEDFEAPILALTGSATKKTRKDIIETLQLEKPKVILGSIYRPNLSYFIPKEYDKQKYLLNFLEKNDKHGLIYIRNRKKTEILSEWLNKKGYKSIFYHAGLSSKDRFSIQNAWMRGEYPIIVCTNAFGMGINKSDLNWVMHFDLPSNMEEYYQETGRVGRDGSEANVITLWNDKDIELLDLHFEDSFPSKDLIKKVYQGIVNTLRLAVGSGEGEGFPVDIYEIAKKCSTKPRIVFNTIKLIERAGYWFLSEEEMTSSRIMFLMNNRSILRYSEKHPVFGNIIQTMLRSYSGLFTDLKNFDEEELAERCGMEKRDLIIALQKMEEQDVLEYDRLNFLPKLFLTQPRVDLKNLKIPKSVYVDRKENIGSQLNQFKNFISNDKDCRYLILAKYFGESLDTKCGKCDNCTRRNPISKERLFKLLPLSFEEANRLENENRGTRHFIRRLLEEGVLMISNETILKR